jgi:hypothetical protein
VSDLGSRGVDALRCIFTEVAVISYERTGSY